MSASPPPMYTYDAADAERDMPALARLISLAFGGPLEGVKEWLTRAGVHQVRVLREGAADVACALRVPMGQFFGGGRGPGVGGGGAALADDGRRGSGGGAGGWWARAGDAGDAGTPQGGTGGGGADLNPVPGDAA